MAQSAPVRVKIPTENPQLPRAGVTRPAAAAARLGRNGRSAFAAEPGAATRGDGRVVVELECGITVYHPDGQPPGGDVIDGAVLGVGVSGARGDELLVLG